MAGRKSRRPPAGRSVNVSVRPGAETEEPEAIEVDGAEDPADENVTVEANGQVRRTNADGSITLSNPEKPRKPFQPDKFDANLAEDPAIEAMLPSIAHRLLEGIENDDASRRGWVETGAKGLDLMGVKIESPSAEVQVDNTISRIKHTGLKEACLNSWASSRAELLPVNGPVKVRDDSDTEDREIVDEGGIPGAEPPDLTNVVQMPGIAMAGAAQGIAPPPLKQQGAPSKTEKRNAVANALESDFNHYLTVTDQQYYPDFSRMLMSRALLGCQFRKVYRDPILRRPVSRWVKGTDLIISNEATSLHGAARITERIPMRQATAKRLQAMGYWRDVALVLPNTEVAPMDKAIKQSEGIATTQVRSEDQLHTFLECYCELDNGPLARNEAGKTPGYPLPFRVTIDKESRQIVEIRRNWKKGDEDHRARVRYVKYGMVPSLGFYDWGFVHLLGDPQRGATMIQQQTIDSAMLASFPGGIIAKGGMSRQRTTQIRPGIGQFVVMDTGGLPIDKFIMPWPYKPPPPELQAVGGELAAQMTRVAGVVNLPVGEGRIGNTPVGTIMAYIDSVTKVPSAIHKDDHIAQQQEYIMLKELFAEDPESLWRGRKKPARKWAAAEEIMDQDLIPAADPNIPSQTHRLMQVQMLANVSAAPQYAGIANQRAIYEAQVRTIGFSNTGEFTMPEQAAAPAPPDPKIVAAQIKASTEKEKIASQPALENLKHDNKMEQLAVQSADKSEERASQEERAAMKAHSDREDRNVDRAHDLVKHGAGIVADMTKHREGLDHERDAEALAHVQHIDSMQQPPPGADGINPSGATP